MIWTTNKTVCESTLFSYNHEFVNAFKSVIIDLTKVVRTALESAASIASLLVTTEAALVEKPQDQQSIEVYFD